MRTLLALMLAVTAAPSLGVTPADGAGQIFVYALRETPARSWIAISCGDTLVAELKQGTYFVLNESPGRHIVSVANGIPVAIEPRSNEPLFIRLDWNYGVGRPPIPVLTQVRQKEALAQIKFLSYIPGKKAHASTVSPTEPDLPAPSQLQQRDKR